MHADRERVAQVLSNLVENAVKYGTPNEASQIHVRIVEAPHALRLEVTTKAPASRSRSRIGSSRSSIASTRT